MAANSQKEYPVTGVGGTGGTVPGMVAMTVNSSGIAQPAGSGNPMAITFAGGNNIVAGQSKLALAATAQQLSATSQPIAAFITIKALSTNSGKITVGGSSVTNAVNGAGNGYVLNAGDSVVWYGADASMVYINGTATNDIVTYFGN